MKKRMTMKRILFLCAIAACATVFMAVPAFAANTTQVSIVGLNAALADGEVPPPRMFTEGFDFIAHDASGNPIDASLAAERAVYDTSGRRVYLDSRRQPIFEVTPGSGTFLRFDASGNLVSVPADEVIFGPAYTFPSDGNEYVFGSANLPYWELRGRGPHGGYTTTSAKCATCHSAHSSPAINANAAEGDQSGSTAGVTNALNARGQNFLTRLGSTSCEFCHLTGTPVGAAGMSTNIVYHGGVEGGTSQLYGDDFSGHTLLQANTPIPNSEVVSGSGSVTLEEGLTCASCHAVHGNVGTWQPQEFYRGDVSDPISAGTFSVNSDQAGQFENNETVTQLSYKMLRTNPMAMVSSANAGDPAATDVETASDPLVYAKDPNQVNQFTMNEWCASCHNSPGLDKTMTSIRPSGLEPEMFDSLVTTFTVNNTTDIHNEAGGFATAEGETTPIASQHTTAFWGVYSGPGQCYTCHRGDLNTIEPFTAQWAPNGDFELQPIPDDVNPPLTGDDSLERFRALGYFTIDNASATEMSAQQARNLACGSCHFGTADYARWAPQSDWPHRSPDGDISLLGLFERPGLELNGISPTSDDLPELVCGRCHVNDPEDTSRFLISHHYYLHGYVDTDATVELNPNTPLSPGNSPAGNSSTEGTGTSNETTSP